MALLAAQNQWSCALACIVSFANDHGIKITQEEASKIYFRFFEGKSNRIPVAV
jgi:ABC-type bacteriocin/lantibiotic exporter with double-glycine peptidase domain